MFNTNHNTETIRWSDTLKRLKPQRYASARISPFTTASAADKKAVILSPKKTRYSTLKAAFFQKVISAEEEDDLPPLSPVDQDGLSTSSSYSSFNESINDSIDHLYTISEKRKKKSLTCPNIVALDRPLPPLPSTKSLDLFNTTALSKGYASTTKITRAAASKSQVQLKRAATWLGLPVQRILASPQVQNMGSMIHQKYPSHLFLRRHNLPVLSISNSTLSTNRSSPEQQLADFSKELVYGTDSDHFAFLNYADNQFGFYSSADRPQEEALAFEVEEPFSLNFIVAARHTNTVIREGLAKIGIWPMTPAKPTDQQELPIAGFTCLNFENKLDILDQGVSRFRLTKPIDKSSNRWLNIELLIDIKVEEVLPAVVHRFPWSYTTHPYSAASYQSSEEDIVSDPRELAISQKHCKQGDFLTLYTRGMAHPTWKRYWVTMEENQLVLHDFTYKVCSETKEPISIIPLIPLQAVSKPSVEDCENVGIARKTGILLQFDRNAAILTEPVRLESDEGLDGKAYVFGDSEKNTIHWRRALSAYITDDDNKNKTTEEGIDLRFLW
ncbi:hypothetical protein MFLAVUS_008875 [Mucor flavus]|uniref:PH domain-containing protein n=1 Tax=Mucor flavus TaxID=439312 RepID=A0ABP9Z8B1_9FUNG